MPKMTILVLISAMAIAAALVLSSPAATGQKVGAITVQKSAIETTYKDLETKLVNQFKNDSLWTDPKQRETLLGLIQAAGVLRTPAAVPVLIDHLNYSPLESLERTRFYSIYEAFPASEALVKVGLPAVPALLEVAKVDSAKATRQEDRTATALVCIVRIYEQAGEGKAADKHVLGKAMARYQIELEIKASQPEVAARLKELLTWPALKPSSALDRELAEPQGSAP